MILSDSTKRVWRRERDSLFWGLKTRGFATRSATTSRVQRLLGPESSLGEEGEGFAHCFYTTDRSLDVSGKCVLDESMSDGQGQR